MKTIKVKKGEILQRKGDLNAKIYVVQKGLLRSYTIDHKGKEYIFVFAPEGWIIADAVESDEPCDFYVEALEDSELIVREKDFSQFEANAKAIAKRILVLQRRIIMLMSYSGLERYEHFIETYPNLLKRVPQRMIASYLGITPEALSKAKGDKIRFSKK
ncbi:Crp/Fnr family transcriptional regulator [Aureivirga sp. CE67]|uniref:Crp/Fnr family transcriptional regulator n=1 Tax=Aureivirga sp. CE67 TaxID=1788983 RepID=UPI0018C8EAA7|nr:Crp/Fnr family transcriptional regulator [Aureivirga sp. CE67]